MLKGFQPFCFSFRRLQHILVFDALRGPNMPISEIPARGARISIEWQLDPYLKGLSGVFRLCPGSSGFLKYLLVAYN
jgi:hypothetical protein